MNDIDEIKSRLNIVDIIGKSVRLKKAGRNFKGLCPFHGEKTPSFVVSPDRQIFHCFGCGKGGTVFDYFMEYHHVDFAEALEDLADLAGVVLMRKSSDTPLSDLKQKIYAVNHMASEFYQYLLLKHPLGGTALAYLKARGISDKSMSTFSLGYSPNSWDGLQKFLRKKGYDEALMEQAGLIIKRQNMSPSGRQGYYDRFRGRVMFTLKDHRGSVVGFAGRVLDKDAKEAKYINSSETPVYVKSNILYGLDVTKGAIQKANEAILMEGELDVISSFQAGIPNAVAIKGSALTEGHVRLLKRFTERLVFALDSDMAGDAAARRGIEIADSAGMDMRVVALPSGKDPDDVARENPGIFKKAINDAIPVYDYFLSSAVKRYDGTTAYGKKKISEEILPVVAKIENPIVQNHYVRKLADTIQSSEDAIISHMRSLSRVADKPIQTPRDSGTSERGAESRMDKLELYVLALLMQGKTVELFEDLQDAGLLPEFSHPVVCKIIDKLVSFLSRSEGEPEGKKIFLVKDFADSLPPELSPIFDEAFLWDMTDALDNEDVFQRQWHQAIREFKKMSVMKKIQHATRRASSDSASQDELTRLQRQLTDLSVELKDLEKEA